MLTQIRAFLAGFLSTMVFHQGLLEIFYLTHRVANPAWNLRAVPPLGVPSVVSLAFWGGVWGIALWWMLGRTRGASRWLLAVMLGALLPSAVALLIVYPLKGMAFAGGWDPKIIIGALLLNGCWGLGVMVFMRIFGERN